jgi:hypothetical protein
LGVVDGVEELTDIVGVIDADIEGGALLVTVRLTLNPVDP